MIEVNQEHLIQPRSTGKDTPVIQLTDLLTSCIFYPLRGATIWG
jgi:hypothetical protein